MYLFYINEIYFIICTQGPNYVAEIDILNRLSQEQVVMKSMLSRILSKLEHIETNLKKNCSSNSSVYLEPVFLNQFPMNKPDEFKVIENLILNNMQDFIEKLVCNK